MEKSRDEDRENEGKRERGGGKGRHEFPQRTKLKKWPGPRVNPGGARLNGQPEG